MATLACWCWQPAVLRNLAERWEVPGSKKPYTFMSVVLISLNPCEWLTDPSYQSYRDKPFDPNKPHPYALAELSFQQLSLAYSQVPPQARPRPSLPSSLTPPTCSPTLPRRLISGVTAAAVAWQ